MPLFRRLPKRGFSNAKFSNRYEIVNIRQLEVFEDGATVNLEDLTNAGLVSLGSAGADRVKILGDGELTKKLEVSAHKFSKSAEEKIESCGGKAKVI
jgi:large subunit ribosomal protein L15